MPHLVVREPGRVPFTLELRPGMSVGRETGNDVILDDRKVSRRHARFDSSAGGLTISDAGSRHGTFVNSRPAEGTRLRDGDFVQVGSVTMTYRDADAPDDDVVVCAATAVSCVSAGPDARMKLLLD